MRESGAFEARNKRGTLLDRVAGEEILITRRGEPVARRVSAEPGIDRAGAPRAADHSRARSVGGLKIADLVDEGRR